MDQQTPVLELRTLCKSFGGLNAVRNVGLTVFPGERKAIIGPNGAGKTTLFNVISGMYPADTGRIALAGQRIDDLSANEVARLGT